MAEIQAEQSLQTTSNSLLSLVSIYINVDVSGKDHIKRGEITIGLQHFLPGMSSVWVTLGQQKILLSQNLSI